MRKLNKTDWPTPLTEVLEQRLVPGAGSIGDVVNALIARGDAIGVDPDGRLAIQEAALERLVVEQEERERIALEEAERAEEERLARLAEHERVAKAQKAAKAAQKAHAERVGKIEKALGEPIYIIENAMRKSYTHKPNTGGTIAQQEALWRKDFTIDELEQWVRTEYPGILEKAETR